MSKGLYTFSSPRQAIAVVPVADVFSVQAGQFWREYGVEVCFCVSADGGIARVNGDVGEVVEAGEEADFGELADAREEGESDMCV